LDHHAQAAALPNHIFRIFDKPIVELVLAFAWKFDDLLASNNSTNMQ
jgi:hypothetical protein